MQRLGLMGRSRKISKQLHIWTRFHLKGEEPGDNFCNKTSMFLTFLIPSKNHVHLENDSSEVLVLLWPFCQARSSEKYVLSNLTPWTFWKLQLSLEEWDIYFQSSLPVPEKFSTASGWCQLYNTFSRLFIYLAAAGLSCGTWDLCCIMQDLSLLCMYSLVVPHRLWSLQAQLLQHASSVTQQHVGS